MKPILLSIILFCFVSCDFFNDLNKTTFLQCDSNCYEVQVSGRIMNTTANAGISGVPVTMKWDKVYCWFCFNTTIDTTYSNKDGYYSFDAFIDSTYFLNGYDLNINIPNEEKYLDYGSPFTHSIYEIPDCSDNEIIFKLTPSALLEIHMRRIEKDTFQHFYLSCHFSDHLEILPAKRVENSSSAGDEDITLSTAADLVTYIKWEKVLGDITTTKTGSIVCKQNQRNIFILNY